MKTKIADTILIVFALLILGAIIAGVGCILYNLLTGDMHLLAYLCVLAGLSFILHWASKHSSL